MGITLSETQNFKTSPSYHLSCDFAQRLISAWLPSTISPSYGCCFSTPGKGELACAEGGPPNYSTAPNGRKLFLFISWNCCLETSMDWFWFYSLSQTEQTPTFCYTSFWNIITMGCLPPIVSTSPLNVFSPLHQLSPDLCSGIWTR